VGCGRRQVPISREPLTRRGLAEELPQILLLIGKTERKPFGKQLVVAMAQGAVGFFGAKSRREAGVNVPPGLLVAQRGNQQQTAENGGNAGQDIAPQHRRRLRVGVRYGQNPPFLPREAIPGSLSHRPPSAPRTPRTAFYTNEGAASEH